jgi:tRNA threonylcarbamoyladenosine biosynthesis protein TsaB
LNILALETSSQWCSVALWLDGRLVAHEELAGQRHSELLLPMVDALLTDAALALRAVDAVAFGAGPGSFTGLRIACGVAQGLAAGAGIATVGVGTLMAMAQASGAQRVLACLDARMGEIYCAAYERSPAGWSVVHPPRLCKPGSAPALDGGGWTGVGSGFQAHLSALTRRYDEQIENVQPELHPRADEVAILGAEMCRDGLALPPEQAHPLYLRDHVAFTVEERRARSHADAAPGEP